MHPPHILRSELIRLQTVFCVCRFGSVSRLVAAVPSLSQVQRIDSASRQRLSTDCSLRIWYAKLQQITRSRITCSLINLGYWILNQSLDIFRLLTNWCWCNHSMDSMLNVHVSAERNFDQQVLKSRIKYCMTAAIIAFRTGFPTKIWRNQWNKKAQVQWNEIRKSGLGDGAASHDSRLLVFFLPLSKSRVLASVSFSWNCLFFLKKKLAKAISFDSTTIPLDCRRCWRCLFSHAVVRY